MKCPYTRLYLAAKIFCQDDEEAQFVAAMFCGERMKRCMSLKLLMLLGPPSCIKSTIYKNSINRFGD
jgi:hypothetical protein